MNDETKVGTQQTLNAHRERALAGISPRARGKHKEHIALKWIYKWGWSAPSIIDHLAGNVGRGLASRLVKRNLLIETRTGNGGITKGVPSKILTLTRTGLNEVERQLNADELLPYELDPHKIKQDFLRHGMCAQKVTANVMHTDKFVGFQTEKEIQRIAEAGVKQHDVLWQIDTAMVGVEIELTAKWGRAFDQFILGCVQSLESGTIQQLFILSDAPAIVKRYKEALTGGKTINRWVQNNKRFWEVKGSITLPDGIERRVICQEFKDY